MFPSVCRANRSACGETVAECDDAMGAIAPLALFDATTFTTLCVGLRAFTWRYPMRHANVAIMSRAAW